MSYILRVFRMNCLARSFFCLAVVLTGASAADPDFTGTWTLSETQSESRQLPSTPWKVMKVEHKDPEIRCLPATELQSGKSAKDAPAMAFMTNGKETSHRVGEAPAKSIAKWEGSALLINTIVSGPTRSYTQMDRWKLSRNNALLTIRRQIVTLHGEIESTLVYERQ